VSQPDRPVFVKQLDGSRYAGLNCTCAAAAMALDRHTLGVHKTTGAYVRALTGDTMGGTNLDQVDAALRSRWGVDLDVERGDTFDRFYSRIKAGQGAILQGWAGVTKWTRWQASESFAGNHAWFVNDHNENGFLVYDPLADGRRDGIATSPMRIPKSVVAEFAAKLNVASEGYRALGVNRTYAAYTRDTEPHVHLKFGGRRTVPFPDRTRATGGNLRSAPRLAAQYVVRPLDPGELLIFFQITDAGEAYKGSHRWYGNHDGTRWVHTSRLDHQGGPS
jgi:hypothetical protein